MKQVQEMPTEGQFAMVWCTRNEVFAEMFMWIGGKLMAYKDNNGYVSEVHKPSIERFNAIFYIKE